MSPRRALAVLLALFAGLAMVGCLPMQRSAAAAGLAAMSVHPRPSQVSFQWPERVGSLPLAGHLHVYDTPMSGWTGFRIPSGMAMDGTEDAVRAATPLAAAARDALGVEQVFLRFEDERAYIVVPREAAHGSDGDGKRYSVFQSAVASPISWDQAATASDPNDAPLAGAILHIRRTWFVLSGPRDEDAQPRGLAVLMPGMYGTPEEVVDRVERSLLLSDWVVLRMLAPPSRTTEHYDAVFDASKDPTPVLERLVSVLDDRAAECAYAVRAAVADALAEHPSLTDLPRAIIGMSGTGILLPTAVALDPAEYDAAVIIAGGANSFRIARESSYRDWIDSVEVTLEGDPDDSFWDEIDTRYLALSQLDSYATAPGIRSVPTLMVHGTSDRAVPAATGELLWERLGKPARWKLPVGHELVFASLMFRSSELVDWINEQTSEAEDTEASEHSP